MMLPFKKQNGFSLIELMVVMAIMALLLVLTGGLVVKNVDQQKRLVEIEKVHQIFKSLSYQAYYRGKTISIAAKDSKLLIQQDDKSSVIEFEQLKFLVRTYQIATSAVVTPSTVFIDSDRGNIVLTPLFETFEPNEMR